MSEHVGYAEAMAELESILAEIEGDDIDVDVLSGRVKRAAALIKLCRERIHETRLEVEEIVSDLTAEDAEA